MVMSKERELLERVVKIANGNIIDEIKEYLAQTEQKPKQWEPKKGEWFVGSSGKVYQNTTLNNTKLFGMERQTKEAAEKAAVSMRRFNRLLAYRDEFAPDYVFQVGGRNHYFFTSGKYWKTEIHGECRLLGVVYFPEDVALELCRKLNSGEVIL